MISSICIMLIGQFVYPAATTFVPYNTGTGYNLSTRSHYNYVAPPVARPKIIQINPAPEEVQGVVTAYDRDNRMITIRTRNELVTVHFHPATRWINQGGPWGIKNGYTEVRYCAGVMTLILPR